MAPLIVLLGNDSSFLSVLHKLSSDAGYHSLRCRPHEVTDTHAVVKRAEASFVILDLWAARREDGWAFLRHLWADSDTTDVPTIVVTGETGMPPMGVDLLRTMRCQVLREPGAARALVRVIEAAFGSSPTGWTRGNSPRSATFRVATTAYALAAADGRDA